MANRLTRRQFLAAPTLSLAMPSTAIARQATPGASPVPGGPFLLVGPTSHRYDEAFEIAVDNLEPGAEVTIRSSFTDISGALFRAEATWAANEYRYISCSETPSIRGDFDVADSMAFIWAASRGYESWYALPVYGSETVTITAHAGETFIGEAAIERTLRPDDEYHQEIRGEDLVAFYFPPVGGTPTPAPAVIVIGGSEGGLSSIIQQTAALLSLEGYAALAVSYFGLHPLPSMLVNIPLEYFGNAIAWLQAHPDVDAKRIGMLGYSRGGEATLLAAAHYPEVKIAISYAGSGVPVHAPYSHILEPAYTWRGEPVPVMTDWSEDELVSKAIPVERINGPVVLISGDGDLLWPSTRFSRVAWDRLQQAERSWPDLFLHYPGAGHSILSPYRPMTFPRNHPLPFGGNPHDDQVASVNSWRAVLNTLQWRFLDPEPIPS